jgi:RNA polymerase sigma-70 factor (ECF subfamily)
MAEMAECLPHSICSPLLMVEQVTLRLADRLLAAVVSAPQVETATGTNEDWPDIRCTLGGDGEAYARLVRKYQGAIAAQMWRFCRQRSACEELTHEVFVEAYLSLRRYRGDAPLVHWLRRIATRVGYRYYQRQANQRNENTIGLQEWDQVNAPAEMKNNLETIEAAEAAATVHALLAKLSPRDRLVLTLIYLEDCSVAEAAEMIGWSQTMVKVQAHRARKKLKKLCDGQLGSPV